MARSKIKFLSNKGLLYEINESKKSYSYFVDDKYANYDIIVNSKEDIRDIEKQEDGKLARAARIKDITARNSLLAGIKPKNINVNEFLTDVEIEDVVFRVMTFEHIPLEEGRKNNPKTEADKRAKCPFPPFIHYVIKEGRIVEVGKSHWYGGLDNGYFRIDHGAINNRLAKMYIKLVNRYGQKPNWSGYTYLDEMKGQALVNLSNIGLFFNESKSNNPFAYYTTIMYNSFLGALKIEKRNQNLRDDLLIEQGGLPSFNKQFDYEKEMKELEEKRKLGPPKTKRKK